MKVGYLSLSMTNKKEEVDPEKEFCSNPDCPDCGKRGAGNIVRYGHDKNGRQRFKCTTCSSIFVETKNTVFYYRKLSEDQIILICKLLVEKNGIRAIERIMEIHRDTVSSIIEDLARHAREVTDFLIHDVGLTKILPFATMANRGLSACAMSSKRIVSLPSFQKSTFVIVRPFISIPWYFSGILLTLRIT
jgi:transposase-like protein